MTGNACLDYQADQDLVAEVMAKINRLSTALAELQDEIASDNDGEAW